MRYIDIFLDTCQTGAVRLVASTFTSQGTVEICYENIWGSVCSTSWDSNDASVVCKQLGYNGKIAVIELAHMNDFLNAGTSLAYSNAYFGQSVSSSILLTGLSCNGNETSLISCPRSSTSVGSTGCTHTLDAGVSCSLIGQSSVFLCSDTENCCVL